MLHLLGRKDLKKGLKIFVCLIVLLLWITGCSPGTNDTKETDQNQRDSTANTLSGPAMPVYFGTWVIKKHIPTPNVSALSLEQINGYLGQEITVNEKQIVTSQGTIENPVYEESTLTNNDLFINWRIQLNNLGIMDDTVTEINVANYQHETEDGLGSGFILTNGNRLFTNIGGVFFELGK